MTHEIRAGAESDGGPEQDANLPDADLVRVYDDPADSDAPTLVDSERGTYPLWAGTERNEV